MDATQSLRAKNGEVVACPEEIKGLRLVLKKIALKYAEEIFKEFTPDITTYMVPSSSANLSETELVVAEACERVAAGTDLVFVILDKDSREFLGVCALHSTKRDREAEVGLWVKKAAQNRGLGREAVSVLKAWSEQNLLLDSFIYPVDRRNVRSRKIPETLGGRVVSERMMAKMGGGELDELIYLIPLSQNI
jgi:RimJ/RimL family protein N-acetyltransferase